MLTTLTPLGTPGALISPPATSPSVEGKLSCGEFATAVGTTTLTGTAGTRFESSGLSTKGVCAVIFLPGSTACEPLSEPFTVTSTEPFTQATSILPVRVDSFLEYSTEKTVPRIRATPAGDLIVNEDCGLSFRASPTIFPLMT